MKMGRIALAVALAAVATIEQAEARTYAHRYGCGYQLHYDYSHSNMLSPYSYIYPAANWGPFFQCHMYNSPVYVYPSAPY
jgi:hypothetical protein